jgi:hypothetical protein
MSKATDQELNLASYAMDIAGDRLAMRVTNDSQSKGFVRVFDLAGGVWMPTALIQATGGSDYDAFGRAISLSGNTLAVSAPNDDELALDAGAVYVFDKIGFSWLQSAKLTAPDQEPGDGFGQKVALDGSTLLVSAAGDDDKGTQAGAVHVFERVAGTWTHTAKWTASDGAEGDSFGNAICLDGDRALVAAFLDDDLAFQAGAAYIFERKSGTWAEDAKLLPSVVTSLFASFGETIALDGSVAVLGSYRFWGFLGTVVIFEKVGATWQQTGQVLPSDGTAGDEFARSIALANGRLIVESEDKEDSLGAKIGGIYVFEAVGVGGPWTETASMDGDGGGMGNNLSASGDRFVLGVGDGVDEASARLYSFDNHECPSLFSETMFASVGAGGDQVMELTVGSAMALKLYLVLGSLSGTTPGISLGGMLLPLVLDPYMLLTANHPNSPPLTDSLGFLDGVGAADAKFTVPPGTTSSLVGATFFHAGLVVDPLSGAVLFATNPIALILTP